MSKFIPVVIPKDITDLDINAIYAKAKAVMDIRDSTGAPESTKALIAFFEAMNPLHVMQLIERLRLVEKP